MHGSNPCTPGGRVRIVTVTPDDEELHRYAHAFKSSRAMTTRWIWFVPS